MLVSDEDECVRSWSVMYLGEHGDATSISALQDALLNDQGHNHEGVPIAELAQKAIDEFAHGNKLHRYSPPVGLVIRNRPWWSPN
ncbi:MAG: HEAT repeat domain-containing protein [Pirellulaceae bacterium]